MVPAPSVTPIKPGLSFCLQQMAARGYDINRLVAGTRLTEHSYTSPETLMTLEQELRAYRNLCREADSGMIGLELGQAVNLNAVGVLGGLLSNAVDLGHASHLLRRFGLLVSTFVMSELMGELGPGKVIVRYRRKPELGELYRFFVDRDVAGTRALLMQVFGEGARNFITHIDFGYPRPREAKRYSLVFACPVTFGQDDTHVTFDYRLASLKNDRRSVLAYNTYLYLCRTALGVYAPTTWQQRVLNILSTTNEFPKADRAAAKLNCSERSLRRHLSDEGCQYSELVDRVRFDRAMYLLTHSRDPIKKIGLQLGYSEPANFVHAFTRWSGISPSQFRNSITARS